MKKLEDFELGEGEDFAAMLEESEKSTQTNTVTTGEVVAIFAISVFAQAAVQLLVRSFYAIQDTVTPLLVSLVTVTVNIGLSFWLVFGN